MKTVTRQLGPVLVCLLLALAACGGDPADPETRVRAVIAAAETAAEDRSTRGLMRHVSEDYRDQAGRDKDALRDLVRVYLLRNQNPKILSRIRSVEFATPYRAEVELLTGMAEANLGRFRTGSFVITLSLDLEDDDEWRVIRASWRRAGEDEAL